EIDATDSDGSITKYEWWITKKYNSGRNEPDTVTTVPVLETATGVYTNYIRVEVVDNYMARNVIMGVGLHPAVVASEVSIPKARAMMSISPNPFTSNTTLNFSTEKDGKVSVSVWDTRGRLVSRLTPEDHSLKAGTHTVAWNGRDAMSRKVTAGVYFMKVSADGKNFCNKVLLSR
ncbi:MAG: T9SS type A sorting domain-containing protein, partial [Fibrobacteres bacterium]|nr:T9SS type A sorting domain-containing protein [Fibrobacterota bacterium]